MLLDFFRQLNTDNNSSIAASKISEESQPVFVKYLTLQCYMITDIDFPVNSETSWMINLKDSRMGQQDNQEKSSESFERYISHILFRRL